MERTTAGNSRKKLWSYLPKLPGLAYFFTGVYVACAGIWFVLWLLSPGDTLQVLVAVLFAGLGACHLLVECNRIRREEEARQDPFG